MYEYCSILNTDYGLNCLKRAAEKGHNESSYVYSIILICLGGELKDHGSKLLASLKRFRTREFRAKIREDFQWMWSCKSLITVDAEHEENDFNEKRCNCLKIWRGGRWEENRDRFELSRAKLKLA